MAVGINQPQLRQDNKESDLDKLAKLIGIGANAYSIYDGFKQAPGREAQAKIAQADAMTKQTQLETMKRRASGQINDGDILDLSKDYIVSNEAPKDMNGVQQFNYVGANSTLPPVNPNEGSPLRDSIRYLTPKTALQDALTKSQIAKNYAEVRGQGAGGSKQLLDQINLTLKQNELEKENFKKTPQGRLEALNSSDKTRYDNVVMGLGAIQGMASGLRAGDWTARPYGDNDFTLALKQWNEAIGRMQSGGAIGKQEEKQFKDLAPGLMDSVEMQQKKLEQAHALFVGRLKTLGFTPEDAGKVGVDPSLFSKVDTNYKIPRVKFVEPETANAGQVHPQDNQALQWAKSNKNDPRAIQILKMNGAQ